MTPEELVRGADPTDYLHEEGHHHALIWTCAVLLLLPLTVIASYPVRAARIVVTPANAEAHGIKVTFLPGPFEGETHLVVTCRIHDTEQRRFHSMHVRLVERDKVLIALPLSTITRDDRVTGGFYMDQAQLANCTVTLWYGEPFKGHVEYHIELKQWARASDAK